MWALRSLGYRTDLFLVGLSGEIVDRGRYVVVRTPSNPDFWWGNFLLYPEPPTAQDTDREAWLADHARDLPNARAILLTWDRPDGARGAADAFVAQGYEIDEGCILTARAPDLVRPPRFNPDVKVEPLVTDAQWDAAAIAQTNAFAPRRSGTVEDLRRFVDRQHAIYRDLQDRKLGRWWGAYVSGELAGSLGLVRVEDPDRGVALARFQLVGVDPKFGRRGVCSTLVHDVARRALEDDGIDTLVMAADAEYHAAKVYESVGFRPTERLVAVIKKPPKA